jgi:hypothetical protein
MRSSSLSKPTSWSSPVFTAAATRATCKGEPDLGAWIHTKVMSQTADPLILETGTSGPTDIVDVYSFLIDNRQRGR